MPFNMFPYSNLHNLNLDWILNVVKTKAAAIEAAAATVETYAARLQAVENSRVSYAEQQQLTSEQQQTARSNIGAAPSIGTVRYNVPQTLDDAYKQQARENIGAAAASDIPTGFVSYAEAQALTPTQTAQARSNISAAAASSLTAAEYRVSALEASRVSYTAAQSLTDEQKAQARTNIGAAASSSIPDVSDVLRYSSQSLTGAQKAQARDNIMAASDADVSDLKMIATYEIQITETATDVFVISNGATLDGAGYIYTHGGVVIVSIDTLLYGYLRGAASFSSDDYGNLKAVIADVKRPGVAPSIGFDINISRVSDTDILTVTPFWFMLVPECGILDNGKILTVGATGAPTWEDRGALVLQFATTNPYTVTTPFSTIIAAINAGKSVLFKHDNFTLPLYALYVDPRDESYNSIAFGSATNDPAKVMYTNNTWYFNKS